MWLHSHLFPAKIVQTPELIVRRPDFGNLEIVITIDDPKAYTAPYTVTVRQHLLVDTDLLEFICLENEKDQSHLVGK